MRPVNINSYIGGLAVLVAIFATFWTLRLHGTQDVCLSDDVTIIELELELRLDDDHLLSD